MPSSSRAVGQLKQRLCFIPLAQAFLRFQLIEKAPPFPMGLDFKSLLNVGLGRFGIFFDLIKVHVTIDAGTRRIHHAHIGMIFL
jgi:hypothetical protein